MQPDNQTPQPPVQAQPQPEVPTSSPEPPVAQAEPQSQLPVEQPQPVAQPQQQEEPTELPTVEPVRWQAAEYAQHDKTPLWYIGFVVVVIALMAVAILMQAWTFAVLILVMAVALMVYTHRPPRQLSYVLSEKGLYINDQLHPLGEFKAFGVIHDGTSDMLALIPVKRFRPSLTVYFPAEVGERLVDLLGSYLPMQDLHLDAFDKIIRKLRI